MFAVTPPRLARAFRPLRRLIVAALAAQAAAHLAAQTLNVYATELPPLSYLEGGKPRGYYVDLMNLVEQRSGLHFDWQFQPWARAQVSTQQDPSGLIVNFTRTEEREPKYRWIERVGWGRYAIFTLKERSIREARLLKEATIGYLLGADAAGVLASQGFLRTEAANGNDANVRKLKKGRIDGWIANIWTGPAVYQAAGFAPTELHALKIGAPWQQWMAASLQLDPGVGDRLKRVLLDLQADGSIDALERRYWGIDASIGSIRDWREGP
jgi:ABC-type amino acid transport substrate-binding protein